MRYRIQTCLLGGRRGLDLPLLPEAPAFPSWAGRAKTLQSMLASPIECKSTHDCQPGGAHTRAGPAASIPCDILPEKRFAPGTFLPATTRLSAQTDYTGGGLWLRATSRPSTPTNKMYARIMRSSRWMRRSAHPAQRLRATCGRPLSSYSSSIEARPRTADRLRLTPPQSCNGVRKGSHSLSRPRPRPRPRWSRRRRWSLRQRA